MGERIDLAELITTADIARLLDVSPQRAHQLVRLERFPRPVGRVGSSTVWRASDIERWRGQRAKQRWIANAVALVPRTGGVLQGMFRSVLQNRLSNALGKVPDMPDASVAEVVHAAIDSVRDYGVPRFDPLLLRLEWPS